MSPVDPPDLRLWPTLTNLFPLWWAQRRQVLPALLFALAFTGVSLAIPVLIQRTIDDAIDGDGSTALLLGYLGAIVVAAVLRFGLNYKRRYATARIGIAVEARLRQMMYEAYLRYPRAFYDRHATGEVISRATNDIYPVRYFIGWGVVQAIQSLMMLVGAAVVLANVNGRLALVAALTMPPIAILTYLFDHRVFPISRKVQQRKGNLTEASDEVVVGIEMVQAFGREDDVRDRFSDRAEAVRSETMRQATVEARYLPGLIFLPSLGIAAVLWFGGRQAIEGTLTIGEFTLFVTLLLQLVWPLEALGWIINLAQRATAAASRSFAWLDGISPLPETDHPTPLPDGPSPSASRTSASPIRPGPRCSRGSTSRSPPARSSPCAARPAPARRRCSTSSRASTTDRRQGAARRRRPPRRRAPRAARRGRARHPEAGALLGHPAREPPCRHGPTPTGSTCSRPATRREWPPSWTSSPDGYDTLIGERGVHLSGGQRQRVALARALVAGSRVLVLDDPMSAVDTETERHLVENLRPAVAGRTVLISGQRLSTVLVADRAVVVQDGRIVENGTPADLMRNGVVFVELFGDEAIAA